MHPKSYLTSKIQVGSIHSKLNYDRLEQVFHSADIPQRIKDRVHKVHALKQAAANSATKWCRSTYLQPLNQSTIPHKHTLHPQQPQQLLSETKQSPKHFSTEQSDTFGSKRLFKSSSLNNLCYNAGEVHWGTTDVRDLYAYRTLCDTHNISNRWNESTETDEKVWRFAHDKHSPLSAISRNTKHFDGRKYLNPIQRQEKRSYLLRKAKDEKRKEHIKMLEREKIAQALLQSFKRSTLKTTSSTEENKENLAQTIKQEVEGKYTTEELKRYLEQNEREFRTQSMMNQKLIELMMSKRNKMYTTRQLLKIQERRKYDIVRDYFHNGVFQEELGGYSCCMNSNKDSQGCQVRMINTATWQTVGF